LLADNELYREAARVLPKLANGQGHISRLTATSGRSDAAYGLYSRRNNYSRPILRLEKAFVIGFRRRGWLSDTDGRLTLTDEGLLWVRRLRAGAEPFREQHQMRNVAQREVSGMPRPVVLNEGESPLGWLRRRKDRDGSPLISSAQFEAGERLRSEFECGRLMPRVTSNWESAAPSRRMRRAVPEGAAALSDRALASRERVARALDAVGPELAGVLVDVCCHLVGLGDAEKSRGWPQRSGKVILQIALTRLARHYGLLNEHRGSANARTRIRHWGSDDFRPSLDRWR
jgi:hypothetical protein